MLYSKHTVKSSTSTVAASVYFVVKRRLAGEWILHNDATGGKWKKNTLTKLIVCLPICLSDYSCRLTFHTEFGAPAVFVDENKKNEEEDASEARQTHGDGNLRDIKRCIRLEQPSQDIIIL